VLEAVAEGAYADLALERELGRQPLDPRDRGLATDLAYGAIRQRRRLDGWLDRFGKVPASRQPPRLRWLLHVGLQQLLAMDRVPASAAVSTCVELAKRQRLVALAPVVNGLLRQAARAIAAGEQLPLPQQPQQRLALEHSLPDWLVQELWRQIGAERTASLAAASNRIPPLDLRVNPLRSSRGAVLEALAAAGVMAAELPDLPQGLTLLQLPGALPLLPGYSEGHWCVQDRAAQRIAPLLAVTPGMRVLDACAAPGGKSTHLAELLQNRGELLALDRSGQRLERVRANALRLGHSCVQTAVADATEPGPWLADGFDRILLDVPCSGLGTLARHVDARWGLQPEAIVGLVALQQQLLDGAAAMLRPGGLLVYATCTVHPAENEQQIEAFLQRHGDWCQQGPALQLWPDPEQAGDGFYAVVLSPVAAAPIDPYCR
jgi:16S rRNA (cytosine967-C5)-methyltransferase